ncbi:MAG: DUF6783 domain-containing protein [Lachnospiraceae bacterium]
MWEILSENEGGVAGCGSRMRVKYATAKWELANCGNDFSDTL